MRYSPRLAKPWLSYILTAESTCCWEGVACRRQSNHSAGLVGRLVLLRNSLSVKEPKGKLIFSSLSLHMEAKEARDELGDSISLRS